MLFVLAASQRREVAWSRRVAHKVRCLERGVGGIYLYHARKAAGTTLREKLGVVARRQRVAFWETEGVSIDSRALALRSVVTVVSIRHPVSRVLSLYWYEHVGWWDGIKKDHSKLRSLEGWVDEWRDESNWKRTFQLSNPGNVYLEIENYYVKMLTGWNRDGRGGLSFDAFDRAKDALERFDAVFVCERSTWTNHTSLVARSIGVSPEFFDNLATKLKADTTARKRLTPKLAPDLDRVTKTLASLNTLDLALYDYATRLDDARVAFFEASSSSSSRRRAGRGDDEERGRACETPPVLQLKARNGIFRPPGHKH